MRHRIFPALAALAALTSSSCYVLPDPPAQAPEKKQQATVTDKEQQEIQAQREQKKKEEEALKKPADPGPATNPDAPPPTPKPKQSYPVAQPVPGQEGFVFSPYNQMIIDVREIPSGTLVADPTYKAAEKKHFRVP